MVDSSEADDDRIDGEITRQFREVPQIGEVGSRWYDWPYRTIDLLLGNKLVWGRLPRRARERIGDFRQWLSLFNELEREKISWPSDWLHNLTVPADEKVELPVFWVAELYSPSYASVLADKLMARAWSRGRFMSVPGDEIEHQLQRSRERSRGGGNQIATFVPMDSESWMPDAQRTRLPDEIQRIHVHLMPLGSALTAVVASVVLSPLGVAALDANLRGPHEPRIKKASGRRYLDDRMFAGIDDVQAERERLHALGRQWLSKEIPGVFSAEGAGRLPVLDLLITHKHDPFSTTFIREDSNYLRALGLSNDDWAEVSSPELGGIRLQSYSPERYRQDDTAQWALTGKWDAILPGKQGLMNGQRNLAGVTHRLDGGARALLTRLAIGALLDLKQRRGSAARDLASKVHSGLRPVASIKRLRRSVLTSSLDLATIASAVTKLASSPQRYQWSVPTLWVGPGPGRRNGSKKKKIEPVNKNLLDDWAARDVKEAAELMEIDVSLTGLLGVVATLTSTVEGIRTQRWAIALSALSLLAAAAAVWFAYLAIHASSATQ